MKKTLSLLIMVLFCLPVFADPIPLDPKDPPILGGGGRDWDKSEILVPNAEIENGVINVEQHLLRGAFLSPYIIITVQWSIHR